MRPRYRLPASVRRRAGPRARARQRRRSQQDPTVPPDEQPQRRTYVRPPPPATPLQATPPQAVVTFVLACLTCPEGSTAPARARCTHTRRSSPLARRLGGRLALAGSTAFVIPRWPCPFARPVSEPTPPRPCRRTPLALPSVSILAHYLALRSPCEDPTLR